MKQELDKLLCEKYPEMMVNRNKPMQETCMCWGFDCGDGWYNILDQLMNNIQHHIDWSVKQRDWAIKYNEMASQCQAGIFDLFEEANKDTVPNFKEEKLARIIAGGFRTVPNAVAQVTLDQVKEKFGTLRFYYDGGDEYISGLINMAESWSAVACEECGAPGTQNSQGWIKTLCETHRQERETKHMNRDYDQGKRDDVDFFFGKEVEHTPAFGMHTLFVVGVKNPQEILAKLAETAHETRHIFFGANHSFQPRYNDHAEWKLWEDMIMFFLERGNWCSLDIPMSAVDEFNDGGLNDHDHFIPQIRVPIPYIKLWNYNTMIKIDDRDFRATNPGVWTHSLHKLKDRECFTDWDCYKNDKVL